MNTKTALLLCACAGALGVASAAYGEAAVPSEQALVVKLKPKHGSGVSGKATLTPLRERVRVVVKLNKPVRGRLPGHIHKGRCKIELNLNVQSGLNDIVRGKSVTVLQFTSIATLRAGTFSVHVHAPTLDVIACGDIPRA
jgi:hypothetical protein